MIGRSVENIAAVLIIIETGLLFSGAVCRYLLNLPLVWSDELASIVFLWIGMLGAAVAFYRLEHLRMSGLVTAATPRVRALLEALSLAAILAFVGFVLQPAIEYAIAEVDDMTPALAIPGIGKSIAIPIGLTLISVLGVLRLGRTTSLANFALALGVLAVIAGLLVLGQPLLQAIGNYRLLVFFVLLVGAAVFSGIPIAFAFGLGTYAYLLLMTRIPLTIVVGRMEEGMSHVILLSVPLFVFLGLLLEITGMARAIVAFLAGLFGHIRGGLQFVLIGAMYLVSGISGSKAADMAAVAPVLFPEMKMRGARPGELGALLAATGAQTETVPPSLVLIMIGSVTGVSIASLFAGGLLPSLLLGAMLCSVVWFRARGEDRKDVRRASRAEVGRLFVAALPAVPLPFLIRAAVVEGVMTATEVSTLGIVYCLLYGIIAALAHRPLLLGRLWNALIETAALTGAVLLVLGTATGMAWALTQSGFSRELASAIATLPGGAITFMIASILMFIVLGSVLEGVPAIVLFGPLLFPIARVAGINEVHYAMVVILSMGIGLFAPPLGVGFYTSCVIGRIDPTEAMKPILPYLAVLFAGVIVVAAVPWISTALL
jgi:tripartite ATP-independent transporter DctM subunit